MPGFLFIHLRGGTRFRVGGGGCKYMKKLMAIVISFVFIFDSTGYCMPDSLRVPLKFQEERDPLKYMAEKISKRIRSGSIKTPADKRRIVGTYKGSRLYRLGLNGGVAKNGTIWLMPRVGDTAVLIDNKGNIRFIRADKIPRSIIGKPKEQDLYADLLLEEYKYDYLYRRRMISARELYKRIMFFTRRTGLAFNKEFIDIFLAPGEKYKKYRYRIISFNKKLRDFGIDRLERQKLFEKCMDRIAKDAGAKKKLKAIEICIGEVDTLFTKNGKVDHYREEAIEAFKKLVIPAAIIARAGRLKDVPKLLNIIIKSARDECIKPRYISTFFILTAKGLEGEGGGFLRSDIVDIIRLINFQPVLERLSESVDTGGLGTETTKAKASFKDVLGPIALPACNNNTDQAEEMLKGIIESSRNKEPPMVAEFFEQEAKFLRNFDTCVPSDVKTQKSWPTIRSIFKRNFNPRTGCFSLSLSLKEMDRDFGWDDCNLFFNKWLKLHDMSMERGRDGGITLSARYQSDIFSDIPEGTIEILNIEACNKLRLCRVVFDWDGTVSDAIWFWKDIEASVIEGLGYNREEAMNIIIQTSGWPTLDRMSFALEEASKNNIKVSKSAEELARDAKDRISQRLEKEKAGWKEKSPLVPGIGQLLVKLKRKGIVCYAASADIGENKRSEAAELEISRYFKGIYGDKDTNYQGKAIFLTDLAGTRPHEIAMIGDEPGDIRAGKKAGCLAIGIARDKASRRVLIEVGADIIINGNYNNLSGILKALKITTGRVDIKNIRKTASGMLRKPLDCCNKEILRNRYRTAADSEDI